MKNKIAQKIKEKLELYGFQEDELTSEEMLELRQEAQAELNGYIILDGVLFHNPKYKNKIEH